ncbi:MAG: nitrophenyl compound nitroreductase subunit ArsF family protein [Candidatus Woesearchaeota archaeon]
MKQRNVLIMLLAILAFGILAGCTSKSDTTINSNAVLDTEHIVNIDKLEIYHFHATNQCYSCKTVGAYAEETVNAYFADELKSGKIVFGHINRDLSKNKDLVMKYGVTGSSLWLGTYNGEEFKAEENVNVWYKIKDKQDYMNYLKGIIEQKLAGN